MRARFLLSILLAAILAGCVSTPDRPPMSARPETREVPMSPDYPGVVVQGTLRATIDGLVIDATARNDGNRTYRVETVCTTPWSVLLFRGSEEIHIDEPRAQCFAFGLGEFTPGMQMNFTTTWDGIIWSDKAQRRVTAPAGEYDWSVRFAAYKEDQGVKRFDLDFPVTIGAV